MLAGRVTYMMGRAQKTLNRGQLWENQRTRILFLPKINYHSVRLTEWLSIITLLAELFGQKPSVCASVYLDVNHGGTVPLHTETCNLARTDLLKNPEHTSKPDYPDVLCWVFGHRRK